MAQQQIIPRESEKTHLAPLKCFAILMMKFVGFLDVMEIQFLSLTFKLESKYFHPIFISFCMRFCGNFVIVLILDEHSGPICFL